MLRFWIRGGIEMYSLQLKKVRARHAARAQELMDAATAENRVFSESEQKEFDSARAAFKSLSGDIGKAEEAENDLRGLSLPEQRKAVDAHEITQRPRIRSANRIRNADACYKFGLFVLASSLAHGNRLKPNSWIAVRAKEVFGAEFPHKFQSVMNEGSNFAGGYDVPEEFDVGLVDMRENYGAFRRACAESMGIVPMSRDTWSRRRRASGLTAYPVGEGVAGTASDIVRDMIRLTAKKWMAITTMTSELNEDAVVDEGAWVMEELAFAFAVAEDGAGFNGDSTGTYALITGLKNKLAAGAKQSQGTGNTWSAITLADFNNMMGKIPDYKFVVSPAFFCNKAFYHSVMERLAMAGGGVTSMEIIDGVARGKFFGYPVNFVAAMPAATAVSTISCYFGEIGRAAKFGDRRGITISMSDQAVVNSVSMFETDEIAIKATERFDINVHEYGTAAAGGPVVALVTGA
jgi:HK97 family phage major capsid protein